MEKNYEISELLDFYGAVLTDKQRDVIEQYYNDDLSLSEIADNFGISRQGVRDAIKRGEAAMLTLEAQIGMAKRYRVLQNALTSLSGLAQNIRVTNETNYNYSKEIAGYATQMQAILTELDKA